MGAMFRTGIISLNIDHNYFEKLQRKFGFISDKFLSEIETRRNEYI
jgi:hypothetical protein